LPSSRVCRCVRFGAAMDSGDATLSVGSGFACSSASPGAHSQEAQEAAIIHSLRERLQRARHHLKEVQAAGACVSAAEKGRRALGRPLCDDQVRVQRAIDHLVDENERGSRQSKFLCRQIEDNQRKLLEFLDTAKHLKSEPSEDYEALQLELLKVVDRLTEVCAVNSELRQRLVNVRIPGAAMPMHERAAWSGTLEQTFPSDPMFKAGSSRCSSQREIIRCSSEDAMAELPSAVVTLAPGVEFSVDASSPSSSKGTPSSRMQGASLTRSATSARDRSKAGMAAAQLSDEITQLEVRIFRDRERGVGLTQRLDTLRARGRQLEAGLQRSREEAAERRHELEEQLQYDTERVQYLMEMAALQTLPAGSDAEASFPTAGKMPPSSLAGEDERLGVVHLWPAGEPPTTTATLTAATEACLPATSKLVGLRPRRSQSSDGLRPRRSRSADGLGLGRPRPRGGPGAVVAPFSTGLLSPRRSKNDTEMPSRSQKVSGLLR